MLFLTWLQKEVDNVLLSITLDEVLRARNWVCSFHQTSKVSSGLTARGYEPGMETFPLQAKACAEVLEHEHRAAATTTATLLTFYPVLVLIQILPDSWWSSNTNTWYSFQLCIEDV